MYIGITQRAPNKRFKYGNGYKDNEYFWQAIEKYGWNNFKHEILYSGLSKEIACTTEIELIAKYNSTNRKYGYNIALGKSHPHTEEERRKISEANRRRIYSEETRRKLGKINKGRIFSKEWRKHISEANKGHIVSEETRKKISEANKCRVCSEETRKKISKANKNPSEETRKKMSAAKPKCPVLCIETGIVYESLRNAERQTGVVNIWAVCHNKQKTAGGLHWKFITENDSR